VAGTNTTATTTATAAEAEAKATTAAAAATAGTGGTTAAPAACTTLTAPANAGDTQLQISDTTGFELGGEIVIGLGARSEENAILGFGSLLLSTPLQLSHPKNGTTVCTIARAVSTVTAGFGTTAAGSGSTTAVAGEATVAAQQQGNASGGDQVAQQQQQSTAAAGGTTTVACASVLVEDARPGAKMLKVDDVSCFAPGQKIFCGDEELVVSNINYFVDPVMPAPGGATSNLLQAVTAAAQGATSNTAGVVDVVMPAPVSATSNPLQAVTAAAQDAGSNSFGAVIAAAKGVKATATGAVYSVAGAAQATNFTLPFSTLEAVTPAGRGAGSNPTEAVKAVAQGAQLVAASGAASAAVAGTAVAAEGMTAATNKVAEVAGGSGLLLQVASHAVSGAPPEVSSEGRGLGPSALSRALSAGLAAGVAKLSRLFTSLIEENVADGHSAGGGSRGPAHKVAPALPSSMIGAHRAPAESQQKKPDQWLELREPLRGFHRKGEHVGTTKGDGTTRILNDGPPTSAESSMSGAEIVFLLLLIVIVVFCVCIFCVIGHQGRKDEGDAGEPSASMRLDCPAGHALVEYRTAEDDNHTDWECSNCGREVVFGEKMYGCHRCEYDICVDCHALNASAESARPPDPQPAPTTERRGRKAEFMPYGAAGAMQEDVRLPSFREEGFENP
jgi:hypothetical protein